MSIEQHPDYHEGFWDARKGEPLFLDASSEYAAGWRAYWACRDIAATFPSELTELGEQFLIPGCEKRPTPGTKGAKATEPDLWDAASNAGRT